MKRILYISFVILISCNKEEPLPVDLFEGSYSLINVIEEHNPEEQSKPKFLAPKSFKVTKSEFLDPASGELVSAYKFNDDFNRFMGLTNSEQNVILGTDDCPNADDLTGVSITFLDSSNLYELNMKNCEGRDAIGEYSLLIE